MEAVPTGTAIKEYFDWNKSQHLNFCNFYYCYVLKMNETSSLACEIKYIGHFNEIRFCE